MNQISKGFTLIELMIVVAIVGLLSGIATARFSVSQARSKQAEATTNLKSMFAAEKAFFADKGRYSGFVHEIGFSPERNNRYAYFVGQGAELVLRDNATETITATSDAIGYDEFKYTNTAPFDVTLNVIPTPRCGRGAGFTQGVDDASIPGTPIWTGAAQGQIDNDATMDLWSISTMNRLANASCDSANANNPAGEPLVELNDVNN
jgi:type IV pilus assembly protein PilA